MKAHSKPEKRVKCSRCGKSILFKEDLFFLFSAPFSFKIAPIHIECFGRAYRRKPLKIKLSIISDYKKFSNLYFLLAAGLSISFLVAVSITLDNTRMPMTAFAILFFTIILFSFVPFIAGLLMRRKAKKMKNEFEDHLPSKYNNEIKL